MLLLVLIVGCIGCKDQAASVKSMSNPIQEAELIVPPESAQPPSPPHMSAKKILKSGHMELEVPELGAARQKIEDIIQKVDAYAEQEEYKVSARRRAYYMKLRVPFEHFDSLVQRLEKDLGEVTLKNVHSQDVTADYVDVSLRLQNKQEYLKQYHSILQKATTIEEILEVQEIIRRMEEEIESKKGRLRYIDDRATHAVLELWLREPAPPAQVAAVPTYGQKLTYAFKNGLAGLSVFVLGIVSVWPFLLIVVMTVLFLRWKGGGRYRRFWTS